MITPVKPYTDLYQEKPPKPAKKHICLCTMFTPMFIVCRSFGFFPFKSTHVNGQCLYKKSNLWLCYSLVILSFSIFRIVMTIDFFNLINSKSLPILLSDVTDTIYCLYTTILLIMNLYRFPQWMKTFNLFVNCIKEGILCQSSRRVIMRLQYAILSVVFTTIAIQITLVTFLHFSQTYNSNFDVNFFINKFLQTLQFMFYAVFITMVGVLIGVLACFEKLTISSLKYTPIHPMKGINETNNTRDFLGLYTYRLCLEHHPCTDRMSKLGQAEIVEFLRIMHEEICLVIYEFNACMNPQFLVHTVIELTVLIIQWYAVIVYMVFTFKAPRASTIHVLNCFFVAIHTLGMFLFLKNAQQLKNMVQSLNNFLLEYSTRISSLEEHQQVRLFIEKLKQHRPLTANGVFTIDLGIAGPISANILTYVLVALQFEIPKEE